MDDLAGLYNGGFGGDIDPTQIFKDFFRQGAAQQHFGFGGQGGMPGDNTFPSFFHFG